jgi:hypothetical protein
MDHSVKTIWVKPGSELDHLLAEADETDLELNRGGIRYRINRIAAEQVTDLWVDYDPVAVVEGMRRAAGSWSDIDAEALKDELRRARKIGSRPLNRT